MVSAAAFAHVNYYGTADTSNASNVYGVRPDFDGADKTLFRKGKHQTERKGCPCPERAKFKRRNARLFVSVCSTQSDTSELLSGT